MVVDDNLDAAESLSALLELDGNYLETAHGGFEAIKMAVAFKPQIVFLDIGMPDMNGYETAEEMKKISSLESTIIIALTGWSAEFERIQSGKTGFDYHLTKPVRLEQIRSLLTTICQPAPSNYA